MQRLGIRPMAAFVGMASLLPFHGAAVRHCAAGVQDPPLRSVVGDGQFTLQELRGRFVAVHFAGSAGPTAEMVRRYRDVAPALAGVVHVFITGDAADALRSEQAAGDPLVRIGIDAGGRLASEFKVMAGTAVSVMLDRDGRELFRLEPGSAGGAVGFDALSEKVRAMWATPALGHYNLPRGSGLAVEGYDVVGYFTQGKAIKGDAARGSEYRGVTYRFSTEANRRMFAADPERYIPAYGGWCASAIAAKSEKVEIDPKNFKVKDGRLLLFYKSLFADALKDWNQNEKAWGPAADRNWKAIAGESPAAVKPDGKP